MKKVITISLFLLLGYSSIFAQDSSKKQSTPSMWTKEGTISFLLNQSSFSNWISGGENSFAGDLKATYQFNYKKKGWNWDNRINAAYGINKTKTNGKRKTNDVFIFNSVLGKKVKKNWFYSFFLNFQTQFTNGYDYVNDANEISPISKFFAPAYLTFGPGFLWKKSDNLNFNISPLTSKITFVTDKALSLKGDFGVEPGNKTNYEFGLYVSGYFKKDIMKNITMENIISLYSNYLKKPKNIDFDYTLNLTMTINKYLSTNLNFQTIYDDDAIGRLQVKEVFGLGVNYTF